MKFQISSFKFRIFPAGGASGGHGFIRNSTAFSLVELLVVMALLSLIMLALMTVFNSTQRAFRASVTQADVLQGGRATMELITSDLRQLRPSYTTTNFIVTNNASYSTMLLQSLPGGTYSRSNLLQEVFILNKQNTKWWGVAYAVAISQSGSLYSLYRLQYPAAGTNDPTTIFSSAAVRNFFLNPTNGGSHVIDGVVHFAVRAYDVNGLWITNGYTAGQTNKLVKTKFYKLAGGECGFVMVSNVVPAAVELQLGVLEDRVLQHAEALANFAAQTNYFAQQSGAVHLFRQRVNIFNVDPTAYQ